MPSDDESVGGAEPSEPAQRRSRRGGSTTIRRIVLLRHAKSAYPAGVADHDRPLAGKGRRNAQATGEWFTAEGPRVDLALCSDAVRALQTWQIVTASLRAAPRLRREPALYGAEPKDVIELLHELPADVQTVVVVGHEPTMSSTALLLAGAGSDPIAMSRLSAKFPTNGAAVLRLRGDWTTVEAGSAVLETFAVPRA